MKISILAILGGIASYAAGDIAVGYSDDSWCCQDDGTYFSARHYNTWTYGDDPCDTALILTTEDDNFCGIEFGADGQTGLTFEGCGTSDLWINKDGSYFQQCHAEDFSFDQCGTAIGYGYQTQTHRCWA